MIVLSIVVEMSRKVFPKTVSDSANICDIAVYVRQALMMSLSCLSLTCFAQLMQH